MREQESTSATASASWTNQMSRATAAAAAERFGKTGAEQMSRSLANPNRTRVK